VVEEYSTDGRVGRTQAIRRRTRRQPYSIRVQRVDALRAPVTLFVCAVGGMVAGGVALATPPLPVFLAAFAGVPVVLLLFLFSGGVTVFEVSELGPRFGVGGLTGRLMARDIWSPGRGRPVIVRWRSVRAVVIRSGPGTGDSRRTVEVGVMVNPGVKVPRGYRNPGSAEPVPEDCPYWQRFPPGRVDAEELATAVTAFGDIEPIRPELRPGPYHLYDTSRLTGLGVVLGVLGWAAALTVRLVGGDQGLAVFAAPLFVLGGAGLGLVGVRRDKRLLSLDDGGLRFGRPVAFVPWSHVERVVVDGQPAGGPTLVLRLGPESRLPRLYERRLRGADPVTVATALSVWLPGRIRLVRPRRG
jgi:hypothetical protein